MHRAAETPGGSKKTDGFQSDALAQHEYYAF